jgi:hypothetical protein
MPIFYRWDSSRIEKIDKLSKHHWTLESRESEHWYSYIIRERRVHTTESKLWSLTAFSVQPLYMDVRVQTLESRI